MTVADHVTSFERQFESCEQLRKHALELEDRDYRSLVYETILLRAFRIFENYIQGVFLSYLMGDCREDGGSVACYVVPRDERHAIKLVKGASRSTFLDWSNPKEIIERCQVFFKPDDPISSALISKTAELNWIKKVRNEIAHHSTESQAQFDTVVQQILSTKPLQTPSAGTFLQMIPKRGAIKNHEILSYFLGTIKECACGAAGIVNTPS